MLMMLVVVFVPGLVNAQQLEFWYTFSSYLFIPSPHPDGLELQPLLHPLVSLGFIGLGLVGLLTLPPQEVHGVTPGFLLVSLCSTAIVLSALTLERAGGVPRIGWLVLLGNASYALYLSHYVVIGFVRALWPAGLVGTFLTDVAFLVIVLVASSAVSVAVYRYVERPLTVYLRDAVPNLARLARGDGRLSKG